MGASFEVFAGVIRGGRNHDKLGDPYEWYIAVRASTEELGLAILGPADEELTKHRREIMQALAPHFERVRWMRRKGGDPIRREYDLTRYR